MNNTQYIAEQLSQLRDLLIVIERGGDKSPDVLYKLAIEKSQKITQLVEQWRNEAAPSQVEVPAEYALWLDGKTEEEAAAEPQAELEEQSIDIEPISMPEPEADAEYVAPFVEDTMPAQQSEVEEKAIDIEETPAVEMVVEEPEVPAELVEEKEPELEVVEFAEESNDEVADFVEDAPEEAFVEDEVEVVEFDVDDDKYGFVEDDDDMAVVDEEQQFDDEDIEEQDLYNRGEPLDSDTAVTVGEMMSVRQAKELRKALSLNDRFRFRRELFGNSDINMNDTLNLLDTMSDLAEAREYLLQDLGWSTDDPVVQEFLTLVERHFK
ncbi:MAG: hypothetical protein IJ442_08745 [Bacteroidaceae bacterium]|nr:hypothetical protein [Bacteroidaceae bacterium]